MQRAGAGRIAERDGDPVAITVNIVRVGEGHAAPGNQDETGQ
jgi:hypothetical protein